MRKAKVRRSRHRVLKVTVRLILADLPAVLIFQLPVLQFRILL